MNQPTRTPSGQRRYGPSWREAATLRDGTVVTLRCVRPGDEELLRTGFDTLSDDSRYRRFHGAKVALSDSEVQYLTHIDGENHVAIGATETRRDGTERGLGVARFVRDRARIDVAEAAVTVSDEVQGQGLGTILLHALVAAAVERGVHYFVGDVLADNTAMRSLLEEISPAATTEGDGGVLRIEMPLPTPSEIEHARQNALQRESTLYRMFRLAAKRWFAAQRVVVRALGTWPREKPREFFEK